MKKQDPHSGSSTPSSQMKRKRGRPHKGKSAVPEENVNVMPTTDDAISVNEATGETSRRDDVRVGQPFVGVIEGSFGAGFFINVQLAGSETTLRAVVFHDGRISPEDILNHQALINSDPSLGQPSEQPAVPESEIPSSGNQVFPTELRSPITFSPDKKDETSHELDASRKLSEINEGGSAKDLQPKSLFPDEEFTTGQQAAYIHNQMDWTNQDLNQTMHEFDTSRQVVEASADGGRAAEDSEPTLEESIKSDPVNLYCDEELSESFQDDLNETLHEPDDSGEVKEQSSDGTGATKCVEPFFLPKSVQDHFEELTTGQQALPFFHKMNELVHAPNALLHELNATGQVIESSAVGGGSTEDSGKIVELNPAPAATEPESMPSEVGEAQAPASGEPKFMPSGGRKSLVKVQYRRKRLASHSSGKIQTSNSSGRPSNDASNLPVAGSNSAPKTSYPPAMLVEEVATSGANTEVNVIQPNESSANPVKPDEIGSDNA